GQQQLVGLDAGFAAKVGAVVMRRGKEGLELETDWDDPELGPLGDPKPHEVVDCGRADTDERVAYAGQPTLQLPVEGAARWPEVALKDVAVVRVKDYRSPTASDHGGQAAEHPGLGCVGMDD